MPGRVVIRCSIALLFAALVSGCFGGGGPTRQADRGGECQWNRSRCLYEGSYEPGERDYAEQEAKELNRASLERLRRSAGR
ncbi:hypothetical protein [Castellaniella defragrans]|uniref:Lipoprotein n=1 Tax=Castellaniella defragrans TaxID=75697 RepID=A0A7W9TMT6_CASDE|nr:hypothetical protein [Castellaniella defragrans]KAB0623086.1 hypothetical protein F7Q88_01780 [Castellaniella defragrans]MBB6082783.1 hypothetical protein [Castellaniella defragrans]